MKLKIKLKDIKKDKISEIANNALMGTDEMISNFGECETYFNFESQELFENNVYSCKKKLGKIFFQKKKKTFTVSELKKFEQIITQINDTKTILTISCALENDFFTILRKKFKLLPQIQKSRIINDKLMIIIPQNNFNFGMENIKDKNGIIGIWDNSLGGWVFDITRKSISKKIE
jgi:hypothetical protein